MPNIDAEMMDLKGSTRFAVIDFLSGYRQLPLAEESRKYHGIITHIGTYVPTRVMQGGRNRGVFFQQSVEPCFADLPEWLKAWLDDFLFHAKTEAELLQILQRFFETFREVGLKVSIKKSVFYAKSVKWCGRILDEDGMRYDPRNAEGLRNLEIPENAAELSQFVNCVKWMSQSIPRFAEREKPLRDIVEEAYSRSGKRISRSIKNSKLAGLGWTEEHEESFLDLKEALKESIKLTYPDNTKAVCIRTDASEHFWTSVISQCEKSELSKPKLDQSHEAIAFLGSAFYKLVRTIRARTLSCCGNLSLLLRVAEAFRLSRVRALQGQILLVSPWAK